MIRADIWHFAALSIRVSCRLYAILQRTFTARLWARLDRIRWLDVKRFEVVSPCQRVCGVTSDHVAELLMIFGRSDPHVPQEGECIQSLEVLDCQLKSVAGRTKVSHFSSIRAMLMILRSELHYKITESMPTFAN